MKLISTLLLIITVLGCTSKKHEMPIVTIAVDHKAALGEGAIWDQKNQRLFWIDIINGMLFVYQPKEDLNQEYPLGKMIGTVVPATDGNVLVALEDGVYYMDLEYEMMGLKAQPPIFNRFNDGKCDPQGRFWVGTMEGENHQKNGSLFMIDSEFNYIKKIDSVSISNGIVWSIDGEKMYYIDTPTRKVMSYNFDKSTGEISNPKVAIQIADSLGSPDGSTMDSEGMIWIALWGGHAVSRWNPITGKLLQLIDVPAKNVTSCAFGGVDLDTLYITTASVYMSEEDQINYPDAGKLFKTVPGVKGIKAFEFNLNQP